MTSYQKPWYYILSHIVLGFIGAFYPIVIILAAIYQLGQLMLNIRIFPIEGKIEEGNSIYHTSKKISEYAIGYIIGKITKKLME